jgi:hypothetical protein
MKFDDKVPGRKARNKYFENIQNQIRGYQEETSQNPTIQ